MANNITFNIIGNTSGIDSSFEKSYSKALKMYSKPVKASVDIQGLEKPIQPLGKITSNFKEFEKSLDAATARVVAFTATTGLIYGLGNAFKRLTSDAIQVEASVARIQSILKASDKDLSNFTDSIFKLANNTGQSFYDAAKAAEEFARQGLSLEKTLKATESALIVARLSGSNLEDTINGLVATVSSFSNELLDYGKVANTLVGIDAKFSTSAAGLIEGIKRVGTVASDAGVSFEELSSAIAAVRQVTGRSESVIGNGLKTIFTNLQTDKVQKELSKLGIQTQKSTGEFLPLINVVDQLALAFQKLNDSQRADLGQKIAGKYQINTFKALLQSFGGADTSLFDQALQTAKSSQDDAIKRNELLNQTTLSSLNKLNNSITSLGNSFGSKIGKPLVDTLTDAATKGVEVLTGIFKDNPIGDFLTGGILSVLKGPGLVLASVALGKLTKKIVFELSDAVKSVSGLNSKTQQNLQLDQAINEALKNGNAERVKAITLARSLEERQIHLNALLKESFAQQSSRNLPYSGMSTLIDKNTRDQVLKNRPKNAANGILPAINQEQISIQSGVGGARKTARPVLTKLNMANGMTPVVVNTDEHIIRNFANTGKDAVFNRNMTRQAGGAQSLGRFGNVEKVMAAGYTPRVKGITPSILEAPFIPTSGETFGLDPRKLDFIRKITENVTGARTKPVRFRKDLKDYGEFWPHNNNIFINPDVISNKSPYYGGYSVPAHEYGHFIEYNSDPALMDLFKSAYKFDVKKKGSLFNQMYKRIGSGAGYAKKNYFSESFADTFAYSFLDRGDREPALGGRAMSDLMRELIMNNIPVKSKAGGLIPNFARRRSRFSDKDDEFLGLVDNLDLDNIGYTPGLKDGLSDRTIKRGFNQDSFTRFTADRRNRIIRIEDTESYQKGDAFKNYSAIADFAKRKDFIIKSAAFVKQSSRDNTKDKGISLLYKLFPQLRYRDGVTKNTSGKYHIGRAEKKFSSFHDLKSQIGQLSDNHIRSISKFSDIQDNFAYGIIPNLPLPKLKSKREIKADRRRKIVDLYISQKGADFLKYDDLDGYYNKSNIQTIRERNRDYETIEQQNYKNRSVLSNINYNVNPKFIDTNYIGSDKREFLSSFIRRYSGSQETLREAVRYQGYRSNWAGPNVKNFLKQKSQKAHDFLYAIETKLALADLDGVKKITTKDGSEVDLSNFFNDESLMDLGKKTNNYIKNFDPKKHITRGKERIARRQIEEDPMGLNTNRDIFKSLNKSLTGGSSISSAQLLNPDYLGIDKIKFLSRSIEDPNYLDLVSGSLKNNLDEIHNSAMNPKKGNSMDEHVLNFLYNKNKKARDFVEILKDKIKDTNNTVDDFPSYFGNSEFNKKSKLPPIDLDIFDDKLPPPPSSISINNSGIPAPSGFHASQYANIIGVTGTQDNSVVFKDDDSDILGSKTQKYIQKKVSRVNSKTQVGKTLNERLEDFKSLPFLERNENKHIGNLIYQSIKGNRKGRMAPQDPVGAQLALGNETIKEKLGFNPESLYGFADDINKAKYYFRGSSLDSFAIQNQLGEFTSSGFSNSDRVLGTNVSSSLLKAIGYAMSTGSREDRPGLVGIYDAKKSREYSDSLASPYSNEKDNTLKFEKLAEKNLIAYFDPVSGRVLSKNNSLIAGRKVDPYKVDYTKRLLEEGNILTKQYENSEQFRSDDSINLYRKVGLTRPGTTLKGLHAPKEIFDNTRQALPRSVDEFIRMLDRHTGTPQPGFISFGQESSSFFDLRSFRPISRDERKEMGKSKSLEEGLNYGKSLVYKKQVKSSDLVDMATLEALKGKTPEEIQEFFSKDRIYDLDSILGRARGFQDEREFTAFTTKPQFNIGKLIAKSAANGIVPNFANPLKDSISREYDVLSDMGYPSYVAKNSIKVGSHDRLKSQRNPNGLGVYNTAQGQMSLGQALGQHAGQSLSNGIVPNFADLKTSTDKVSSKNLGLLTISTNRLSNSFSSLGDYLSTSFLSSLKKTIGSIISISDAAKTQYKGIIDPTAPLSNKNATLVDPTGRAYSQTETLRRLGLPTPGPIAQNGLSSNIFGNQSLNKGKSINYRELAKIPFDRTMITRLGEQEAIKKSNSLIDKSIQDKLSKPPPLGNIKTTQVKGAFGANDISETIKKLGLPLPTPILYRGFGPTVAELPPILRNKVQSTQAPIEQTVSERLKIPKPDISKKIVVGVPKPQPVINERLSYQQLVNRQLSSNAIGLNLDVDAARKEEVDTLKRNNEAIEKDIQSRIEAQKQRENREKNIDQYEKDKLSREKRFAKDARVREQKKKFGSLVENRISTLQFGGPQEDLKKILDRAGKTLGSKKVSEIENNFKSREREAFKQLSSQTGLFTSDKKFEELAKKLNISTASEGFSQIKEAASAKRSSAIQTTAFALPFITGGIANTLGGEDSRAGRITSSLGEAAGTALTLSQFGPPGIAAGILVGSFQALSAISKELGPDFNELSKKSRELSAESERQMSSMQGFLEASNQLKSLVESGASSSTIAQAKVNLSNSTRAVSGDSGLALLNAKTDEEKISIIQKVTSENQREQGLVNSQALGAKLIEEKATGNFKTLQRFAGNRQFLGASDSQTIASELVKSIDFSKISPEGLEKAGRGAANLNDLGLDNSQIRSTLDNLDKFFSNGTADTKGASKEVLKFVQSLVVGQKAVDEIISKQLEAVKLLASTKESLLNIVTSVFAQNQFKNRSLLSDNEINFIKAENSLSLLSSSLTPEALLKGSTAVKRKRIDQEDAIRRNAISEEYTSKILEDVMSQVSNTSLETQIKIQDVLNQSVTGKSPFDPLKLTGDIQSLLDPEASKTLQSQLLKTNIEMAAKLDENNNQSKLTNEQLNQQTLIEEKQLNDTRLINLLGGFKSNFRDVLRSIKEPKGGLTTRARGEASNNYQFGEISNLGGAKVGSIEAVDRSQRNLEIATNRADLFSDVVLPSAARERLNKRNYNDTYLAAKSNVENRALAFGQSELLPQFDILKSSVAGKDQGSIVRKAIDAQLSKVKASFDIGQTPTITPDFIKTVQSISPKDQSGAIERALDSIINAAQLTEDIFTSSNESAKALADQTIKTDKFPPEFDAQIQAIGDNTSIIFENTISLNSLNTVLSDLPDKINKLQKSSLAEIKSFNLSNQINSLQSDSEFKVKELESTGSGRNILNSVRRQASEEYGRDFIARGFNEPAMSDFIKYAGKEKASSSGQLEDALKKYLSIQFPNSKNNQDKFNEVINMDSFKELSTGIKKDSSLLTRDYSSVTENKFEEDINKNKSTIEKLEKLLKELNATQNSQSNEKDKKTSDAPPVINISFNGVGSVDPNKVKEAVYSAIASINKENNLPPPIQRPVTETAIA